MGSEKKERKGKKKLSSGFTSAIASPAHNYLRLDYVSCKRSNMSHFRAAYPLDYTLSRPPTPSILRRTAVASRAHPADTRAVSNSPSRIQSLRSPIIFPRHCSLRSPTFEREEEKGEREKREAKLSQCNSSGKKRVCLRRKRR